MKKFTLFIALLVCAVGFSQRTTDVSSLGENNPVKAQTRTVAVITEAAVETNVSNFGTSNAEKAQSQRTAIINEAVQETAQETNANYLAENNPVFDQEQYSLRSTSPNYGTEADCSQSNPSNAFENGRGFNAGNGWTVATDIMVPMGSDMSLSQLTVYAFNNVGATILSADIVIFDDDAGLPGNVISAETIAPTSETYVGTNFGFDLDALVFDITIGDLAGDVGLDTWYWVAIQVTCSDGGPAYWENSTASAVGLPQAFNDGGGWTIPDATQDSVYEFTAECNPLGTSDNTIEGFSYYPNPATNVLNLSSQENIERVSIFNILGQKVVDLDVNATSTQLNVDHLTTGTYIMKVSVEGQTGTYKIIKN